ncbi:MAG: class I SAM-dependent methyltransferase [Planctomycetota bacterium]
METKTTEQKVADALHYIRNQREQLAQLRDRVSRLENLLEHCLGSAEGLWLFQNRSERMDPTVPIFDPGRAEFHLARYRFAAGYAAGKEVVDIACGTGYGSELLAAAGKAASVTGIDICPEAIHYARSKHCQANMGYLVGSVTAIPLPDESSDVVVSFETIEHVEEDGQAVAEYTRVLRPGGLLICSTPNGWPLEIAPHHKKVFDRDSFVRLLQPHFAAIELFNQNSGTPFPYNHGQPAGIQPTTDQNHALAECFLAVCKKPDPHDRNLDS